MKLITEMNILEENNVFFLVHFPIAGFVQKVGIENRAILENISSGDEIYHKYLEHTLVKGLIKENLIGDNKRIIPKTKELLDFKPIEATLNLTETCNLGCSYCYASSNPSKNKPLELDVAKKAVAEVIRNAKNTKSKIAEYRYIGGGEPTVEWKLIEDITNYISEQSKINDVKKHIRLITNGTLLNDKKVKWLSENIEFVTLSFDILPELQNINRPYANGKATHSRLVEVCKLLGKYKVPFHLRTTISSEASNKLIEMVQYTIDNIPEVKAIRLEPMAEIGRINSKDFTNIIASTETTKQLFKPAQSIFIDQFKEAYRLGKENGINVFNKFTMNHLRRSTRFCNSEFSVNPNGVVSACHRYSRKEHDGFDFFKIGDISADNLYLDVGKINKIRSIDNGYFEDCKTCYARWSCASGCLSARYKNTEISEKGPLCYLTKELLKFSLLNELED